MHWRGKTFEADSKEGLSAVLDELEKREGLLPPSRAAAVLSRTLEEQLLKVLRLLTRNPKGIEAEEVREVADIRGARGLGSASKGWRRVLMTRGFELDDVMKRSRDGDLRLWLPGPRIGEAIEDLSAKG